MIWFYIAMAIVMTMFFIYVGYAVNENTTTRENNFNNIENAKDCKSLAEHYREALGFERKFAWGGYSNELKLLEESVSKELSC